MSDYVRITVPILKDDFFILRDDATKHYRDTRQHAAWLLRQALSGSHADEVVQPQPPQAQQPVAA